MKDEMRKNNFLVFVKIFSLIFLLNILQGCSSSLEVASVFGKKYLITKDVKNNLPAPIYKVGNRYEVNGKYYIPKKDLFYNKTGIASWYGPKFHGKLTANGEIYNQNALTAAHKTLPLPSAVKVTNLKNNKSVILRVNDRGPFINDRIIDLSSHAADLLDLKQNGTGLVRVTILQKETVILEKLAKKGIFLEIKDLPKPETPNITRPQNTLVKVEGRTSDNIKSKINYDLKNLKKRYKIFIKLGSFSSLKSAEIMKDKLSFLKKIKIYKKINNGKVKFFVKSGPYSVVNKVDKILLLLKNKGMQGAKIIIE